MTQRLGLAASIALLVASTTITLKALEVPPLAALPTDVLHEMMPRAYTLHVPDVPSDMEIAAIDRGATQLPLTGVSGNDTGSDNSPCGAAGGCVGAYSLNRAIVNGYVGNLFQLSRSGGGGGTQDIGLSSGTVNTSAIASFCGSSWPMSNGAGANSCAFHKIYDQTGNANHLIINSACSSCTDIPFGSNPANNNVWFKVTAVNLYLNVDFATNAPAATAAKSIFMVANDTLTSDSGDGTFGLFHRVQDPSNVGTDFAIDQRSAINGQPARLMGVDLEQDVMEIGYGYGATDVIPANTNLQPPMDYVGIATTTGGTPNAPMALYFNNQYTYSATYVPSSGTGFATGQSIRVGAGGDGTAAKTVWYEGGVVASSLGSSARNKIFNNLQTFYGISTSASCTEGSTSHSIAFYATLTGAWGLRKFDPAGHTPIAVLTRDSDSQVQIITSAGSSGCDFDTTTANSFCTGTTCHPALLPNQAPWPSFGHQDLYTTTVTCSFCPSYLENSSTTNTPILTFNCVGSTHPCMTYSGTGRWLQTHNNQNVTRPYSAFGVSNRTAGNSFGSVFGDAGNVLFLGGASPANTMLFQANSSGAVTTQAATDGSWHGIAGNVSGSTENACADGSCTNNASATTTDLSNSLYGIALGFNGWVGTVTEAALAPSAVSTGTIGTIQTAQKNYWGY